MTVASSTAKSGPYNGNGSQTVFAYGFKVFADTELQVIRADATGAETTLSLGTGYTVSGVGNDAGGNVTLAVAPATGQKVTILRSVPLTQGTDLRNQGGFYPEVHERVFDRITMMVQQLKEAVDRAVKVTASSGSNPDALIASIQTSESNASASASSASASATSAATNAATASAAAASISLPLPIASGGTGATSQSGARTALGLGTLATANDVATANLQNNAVTVAKLAREGSAGQVLTSNGAGADPSYQAVAGGVPTGSVFDFAGYTAPSGYLLCDGSAVSRTTYASLWSALSASATVTITIASPGVVTWNSHPLQNGDPVRLQTTGALPTGLAANTTYFVVSAAANTFQLAATRGGAAINTSGTQSGTHTAIYAPHGWGDNSTTFNVPDLRGRTTAGRDNMGGSAANRLTTAGAGIAGVNLGDAGGAQTVTLTTTEMPAHTHSNGLAAGTSNLQAGCGSFSSGNTGSTGGGGAHQNTQPTLVTNKIIKT